MPEELDQQAKKTVLRLFTYGLYVVTTPEAEGQTPGAFTANWLSQASFEPPLVMVSVEADSYSLPLIRAGGRFAVSVLESGQRELAGHFGKKARHAGNKLADVPHHPSASGLPVLDAALGYVVCEVTGEIPAGDSVVVIGAVIEAGEQREGEPLTMREAGFRHAG
ncbi:MAG TPA: flavin reductase family protein [Thermomicrobiaceae bacterium]|nr:flavin reductase family protein [Thermomicrobiaceae bacterium]